MLVFIFIYLTTSTGTEYIQVNNVHTQSIQYQPQVVGDIILTKYTREHRCRTQELIDSIKRIENLSAKH